MIANILTYFKYFTWNDQIWIIIGAIFMILSLIGCFVKNIPGVPFGLAGLLILQLMEAPPFYLSEMLILSAITIFIIIFDYQAPVVAEKFFKSAKIGIIVSTIVKLLVLTYMGFRFVSVLIR